MRYVFVFLMYLYFYSGAQEEFVPYKLKLRDSAGLARNEFSGMALHEQQVFLLCQNEAASGPWSGIYTIPLSEIEKNIIDTAYALTCRKNAVKNLDAVINKLNKQCNGCYDGLEAMLIIGTNVFFAVETKDFASDCFIIRGNVLGGMITVDSIPIIRLKKPAFKEGSRVCNMGIESLAFDGKSLLAFFEFNYFKEGNYYYEINMSSGGSTRKKIVSLPFRLTDVTETPDKKIIGLNYFYAAPEGHCETVYRPLPQDVTHQKLVYKGNKYHNYCRLVEFQDGDSEMEWKHIYSFPPDLCSFNWEGLLAYGDGFLAVNDEYADKGKKYSQLIFLQRKQKTGIDK